MAEIYQPSKANEDAGKTYLFIRSDRLIEVFAQGLDKMNIGESEAKTLIGILSNSM